MTVPSIDPAARAAPVAQPRPATANRPRRALRLAGYGVAGLLVAYYAGSIAWKMSGSNQWELEFERDGVKVYSLKAPGSENKQFRAVTVGNYSLNQLVGGLIENSTPQNCRDNIPGCLAMQVVTPWSAKTMSDTVMWRLGLPGPFAPREMILRSQVIQDPASKAVTVNVLAAPNALPRTPGTVRVTHLQNRWVYTPAGNGRVQVEFLQDIDMGGMFPAMLLNLGGAEQTYQFIHDQLPKLLDSDRLRAIRYDFIQEG
jgi:hypothetical protein